MGSKQIQLVNPKVFFGAKLNLAVPRKIQIYYDRTCIKNPNKPNLILHPCHNPAVALFASSARGHLSLNVVLGRLVAWIRSILLVKLQCQKHQHGCYSVWDL